MIIWLAYVNYPITTAVYMERALRQSHVVRSVGPRLPEEAIEIWGLQNMHLPLSPLEIETSFTPDMAAIMASTPVSGHPDLYLWVESVNGYHPQNLTALNCPTACYLIDTHYHLAAALETARQFDVVFIAQLVDLEAFRAVHPRVYWLPLACDPEIHGRHDVTKLYDVGFVGSMNPRRQQMLDFLAQHVTVHRERSFWRDMARTFSESRIVLNDASFDDLNMRFFEALASGSLLLSNSTCGSAQDILFHDGEEYACHNDTNLLDVVQQYLTNDDVRERVAKQGRQRVLAAHTYRHRMDDLLDVMLHGKKDTFSAEELRERSIAPDHASWFPFSSHKAETRETTTGTPRICSIITSRYCSSWPTWQMVFEWEDILAKSLGVPLKPLGENCSLRDPSYDAHSYDLMFFLLADDLRHCGENDQIIPIVMDLWRNNFDDFKQRANRFPLIFVTSLQAFRELSQDLHNLRYLPFCLADQYLNWDLPAKDIEVIHYGRRNPLLEKYMTIFLDRYPATRYVTTEVMNTAGNKVFFISNHAGVFAESDTRSAFMNILGRSKVSLVSTVGMDGSRNTGGIDPVSPRFYESLAADCHLVGRIPVNEEFRVSGMNSFCHHVDSYDNFEKTLLACLSGDVPPRKDHIQFLKNHLASTLAPRILEGLRTIASSESLCNHEVSMQGTIPQIDLTHRLNVIKELKSELTPSILFANYRTLGDVIGFYADFWGLDLFNNFNEIIAAQTSIVDALQHQALELLYRKEPCAARTVARRAMELASPDSVQATLLYADLLRRNGEFEPAKTICHNILDSLPPSDEAHAILDMCSIDELLPLEMEHYHVLHKAHAILRPRRYVEIGVSSGKSLALSGVGTSALGVDPMTAAPEHQFFHSPAAPPKLFKMTSNDFFQRELMKSEWEGASFDMAFIDGLHLFEQALMDFVNLERRSSPDSVIFLHDCLPVSVIGAERERRSMVWTGDTWKVIACLKKMRPDLEIITFPVRPSGLAMIRNLDRNSKVLINQFDLIVEHFVSQTLSENFTDRCDLLNVTTELPDSILRALLKHQGGYMEGTGTK